MSNFKAAKAISTSESSVVALRAELLIQEEALRKKARPSAPNTTNTKLKYSNGERIVRSYKQNKGLQDRLTKDSKARGEDKDPTLEASWIALQRKSVMYNEMKDRGISVDDEEAVISLQKEFSHRLPDGYEEDIDEFGRVVVVRTRETASDISNSFQFESETAEDRGWVRASDKTEVSKFKYFKSNEEKRNLGTGYYQFSQNEEVRITQQAELNVRRDSTIQNRLSRNEALRKRNEALSKRKEILKDRYKRKVEGKVDDLFKELEKAEDFADNFDMDQKIE